MKTILFSLILALLLYSLCSAQDVIIDTLYSITSLEGGISYNTYWNTYGGGPLIGETINIVGDSYNNYIGGDEYVRGFISFPIQNIPDGFIIEEISLTLHLAGFVGNGYGWTWPIWDINGEQYIYPLIIDHVDYGNTLYYDDLNCPVLHPHICEIDSTITLQYCQLDIKNSYIDDLENDRSKTQYRFKFPVDTDYDGQCDYIGIGSSYADECYRPFVEIIYTSISEAGEEEIPQANLISVYPNPARDFVVFEFDNNRNKADDIMKLEIYNIKGQRIYSGDYETSEGQIIINFSNLKEESRNGIYLYRLWLNDRQYGGKIILIK